MTKSRGEIINGVLTLQIRTIEGVPTNGIDTLLQCLELLCLPAVGVSHITGIVSSLQKPTDRTIRIHDTQEHLRMNPVYFSYSNDRGSDARPIKIISIQQLDSPIIHRRSLEMNITLTKPVRIQPPPGRGLGVYEIIINGGRSMDIISDSYITTKTKQKSHQNTSYDNRTEEPHSYTILYLPRS